MTRKPICGECSTRYEGVNYSKEGLLILQQRRSAVVSAGRPRQAAIRLFAWCLAPVLLYLMYASYLVMSRILIGMLHTE